MCARDEAGSGHDDGHLGSADPAEVLALVEGQRAEAQQQLDVDSSLLYLCWGAAWLPGYLLLYLGSSEGKEPSIPLAVAGAAFAGLMVAAGVATAAHIYGRVHGIRGPSSTQGTMYGLSWLAAFATMTGLGAGLSRAGMSDEVGDLYFFGAPGIIVGLLYLAGGSLWLDRIMYAFGAWLIAVFTAATLVGTPAGYLLAAGLGGGGFVLTGLWVRQRRGATAT